MAGTPRREEQQPLPDLVVIIGEERIPVPTCVFLAAESPVFAAMYRRLLEAGTSSQSEFQVELADVCAEVFKDLLMFANFGVLPSPESGRLSTELLALAHKFQVKALEEHVEQHLATSGLSAETVLPRLLFAHRHGAAVLKKSCLRFLVAHFADVVNTPDWEVFCKSGNNGQLMLEATQAIAEYIEAVKRKK